MNDITVFDVVSAGQRLASLRMLRDRLASELDEERAAEHKRECRCTCGMADGRVVVALVKELRSTIAEIDSLPEAEGEVDPLDVLAARHADELASRRARRVADAPGS